MATQFYSRYIPPPTALSSSGKNGQDQIDSRPKKRKKFGDAENDISNSRIVEGERLQHSSLESLSATETSLPTRPQGKNTPNLPRQNGNRGSDSHSVASNEIGQATSGKTDRKIRKKKKESRGAEHKNAVEVLRADSVENTTQNEPKHQHIRKRFEKSKKLGERLADQQGLEEQREILVKEDALDKIEVEGIQPLPQPAQVPDSPTKSTISALPNWLAKPTFVRADATTAFVNLNIEETITKRLLHHGFEMAFPIQAAVLQLLLPGSTQHQGDLCVSATTGSGKSLAYTIPIVQSLKDMPVRKLRAVVVVPTRELVDQAKATFHQCNARLEVGTAVGSKSFREERESLVKKIWKFDPVAYEAEQKEITEENAWDWVDQSDEDDNFDEWLPNLVPAYESKVDVLICTPGRLVDHLTTTKGFTLERVQWLVIDEADKLLDQKFQQWLDLVMPELEKDSTKDTESLVVDPIYLPLHTRRVQKVILSATMARDVSKMEQLNLRRPALVVLESENLGAKGEEENRPEQVEPTSTALPARLTEIAISVREISDKPLYLLQIIEEMLHDSISMAGEAHQDTMSLSSASIASSYSSDSTSSEASSSIDDATLLSADIDASSSNASTSTADSRPKRQKKSEPREEHGILVFTNTNEDALRLCRLLAILRPSLSDRVSPLTKSSGTASGRKTLAAFRKKKVLVIIASDRASRGLDLKNLAKVVNYDMPATLTSYVHRAGRTARAGLTGTAITLIAHHEGRWFWNEIGRSPKIERARKVARRDMQLESLSSEDRESYDLALEQLGKEARGVQK